MSMEKKLAQARHEGYNQGWQDCAKESTMKTTLLLGALTTEFNLDLERVQQIMMDLQQTLIDNSELTPKQRVMARRSIILDQQGDRQQASDLIQKLIDQQADERLQGE